MDLDRINWYQSRSILTMESRKSLCEELRKSIREGIRESIREGIEELKNRWKEERKFEMKVDKKAVLKSSQDAKTQEVTEVNKENIDAVQNVQVEANGKNTEKQIKRSRRLRKMRMKGDENRLATHQNSKTHREDRNAFQTKKVKRSKVICEQRELVDLKGDHRQVLFRRREMKEWKKRRLKGREETAKGSMRNRRAPRSGWRRLLDGNIEVRHQRQYHEEINNGGYQPTCVWPWKWTRRHYKFRKKMGRLNTRIHHGVRNTSRTEDVKLSKKIREQRNAKGDRRRLVSRRLEWGRISVLDVVDRQRRLQRRMMRARGFKFREKTVRRISRQQKNKKGRKRRNLRRGSKMPENDDREKSEEWRWKLGGGHGEQRGGFTKMQSLEEEEEEEGKKKKKANKKG